MLCHCKNSPVCCLCFFKYFLNAKTAITLLPNEGLTQRPWRLMTFPWGLDVRCPRRAAGDACRHEADTAHQHCHPSDSSLPSQQLEKLLSWAQRWGAPEGDEDRWKSRVTGSQMVCAESLVHVWGDWNFSLLLTAVGLQDKQSSLPASKPTKVGVRTFPHFRWACWGLEVCSVLQDQRIRINYKFNTGLCTICNVWRRDRLLSLQRKAGKQRFHKSAITWASTGPLWDAQARLLPPLST